MRCKYNGNISIQTNLKKKYENHDHFNLKSDTDHV